MCSCDSRLTIGNSNRQPLKQVNVSHVHGGDENKSNSTVHFSVTHSSSCLSLYHLLMNYIATSPGQLEVTESAPQGLVTSIIMLIVHPQWVASRKVVPVIAWDRKCSSSQLWGFLLHGKVMSRCSHLERITPRTKKHVDSKYLACDSGQIYKHGI